MNNYILDKLPMFARDFLFYMSSVKGRSENTILSYSRDIHQFLVFLVKRENPSLKDEEPNTSDFPESKIKKIQLYDILEYLAYTNTELKNNAKSRSRKSVALRQFFKYLTNNKQFFTVSPAANLELPKAKKQLPKYLTFEQSIGMLGNAANITDWSGARDYCMLVFFLNCGMRLSELVGINIKDITTSRNYESGNYETRLKVMGKGSKERIIYLNSACVAAFEQYLEYRKSEFPNEKALFVSSRGTRITNRRVQQIIEKMLSEAGLSGMGLSVHKLRHTAATLMYQNGVDVRVLKDVLGHENLDTTQIYTHVADNQMKNAMDNNPLSEIMPDKHTKGK